jgi:hypothetical protein
MKDHIRTWAVKGELPVKPCYVDVHDPEQRGFYSVAELEQRGWTRHMIRTLLKPDRIRKNLRDRTRTRKGKNRAYRCSPLAYEYSSTQVSATEKTGKWLKAKARANRKVERTISRSSLSAPRPTQENKPPEPRFTGLSVLTPTPDGKGLKVNLPPVAPDPDSSWGRLDERMRQRFKKIDRGIAKQMARPR